MTQGTLSGYLGILIVPNKKVVGMAAALTKKKTIASAEYVTKPEGMHITLYQAKNFHELPEKTARSLVATLNNLLSGCSFLLDRIACDAGEGKYLFWHLWEHWPDERRLAAAHHMSLALSVWRLPTESDSQLTRLFGGENVLDGYVPHITLAANSEGFPKVEPFYKSTRVNVERVVLARMGEWGKIEEILF